MELKKGTTLQGGKYKIEQTLGQGSFGITYLATAKFSASGNLGMMDVVAKVAIKEFFMSDINGRKEDGSTVEGSTGSIFTNYKKRFRKEAENLSKLLHPNIVKVFDVFDENNTTYYVMEYLSETNLNKYIKDNHGLQEQECIALTQGIGNALQYMHNALMLHLDLKPGNIMLRNGEPVLIDFGLSKQFNANGKPETSTTIGQGTPGYAPLEQQNYNGSQSSGLPYSMDVYALGGTMFKMITAETPPDASSIFNDGFPKEELLNRKTSSPLADVIEKAMAPGKKERFQTVSELLLALPKDRGIFKSKSKNSIANINTNAKVTEESTEFANADGSNTQTTTGREAALKVGSIIKKSPHGDVYVVDKVFISGFNFTYFCHDIDKRIRKVVVRELFFQDYNCRKDGIVTSLGDVDWISRYQHRFTEVGNILKKLSGHPNLENYVDSFNANGTCYLITDYISGETLSDIQERTKKNFTEKNVINIIKQICNGLTFMNTHRILHLDVKPSNIIKSSSNKYVLLDFGLSKIPSSIEISTTPTIGYTPGYSPIEQQCGNGMLTPASDVYSLGATMYKLLTGERPKEATEIFQNGFHDMELKLKEAKVSFELIKVIKIAMNPLVKNRYQSPEALSKALSSIKSATPSTKIKSSHQSADTGQVQYERSLESDEKSKKSQSKTNNNVISNKTTPFEANTDKKSDIKGKSFWVIVHLLLVGIMLVFFFCEHVYRGCLTSTSDGYPNTYIQTIMQAISDGRTEGPYGSMLLLILGLFFLLEITWNKKTRTLTSFCGTILIGMSSYICDLFGGCNYDNMVWIIFAALSIASSWCISMCTAKTTE